MASTKETILKLAKKHEQLANWMRRQATNLLKQAERHDRQAAQLRTHLDQGAPPTSTQAPASASTQGRG